MLYKWYSPCYIAPKPTLCKITNNGERVIKISNVIDHPWSYAYRDAHIARYIATYLCGMGYILDYYFLINCGLWRFCVVPDSFCDARDSLWHICFVQGYDLFTCTRVHSGIMENIWQANELFISIAYILVCIMWKYNMPTLSSTINCEKYLVSQHSYYDAHLTLWYLKSIL